MAGSLSTKYLCLLISLTVCSSLVLSASSQDPDPQCTDDHAGLSACNFDSGKCYQENEKPEIWKHVKDNEDGPFTPYDKGYVYVDAAVSQGKPKKLTGNISGKKKAICVTFFYATTGTETIPIKAYIQDGEIYRSVHEVKANTEGEWESTEFSCCLPNLEDSKKFAIEAASSKSGTVAIDFVDVRRSDMPCENGELVCYPSPPSQAPLDPGNTQTCPSDQGVADAASCDFDSKGRDSPNTCEWENSAGWEGRQKIDGSGRYDVLQTISAEEVTLTTDVGDEVLSICMEIQFAVLDINDDLGNAFSININSEDTSSLWGEAYNYDGKEQSVWKRNYFQAPLPKGTGRKIQLNTKVEGLKIDYIKVISSDESPPKEDDGAEGTPKEDEGAEGTPKEDEGPADTPQDPETPQKGKKLLSCPITSEGLIPPLCGWTSVPAHDPSSKFGWLEKEPEIITSSVFPGKDHFILYKAKGQDLKDAARATLSTKSVVTDSGAVLDFSYALKGLAFLEVYVEYGGENSDLVWVTDHETAAKWVPMTFPIKKTGEILITFNIVPGDKTPSDDLVLVGLSTISVTEPVASEQSEDTETEEEADDGENAASGGDGGGAGSNTGVIVGSIIGVVMAVLLIGGAVWWFYFRQRNSEREPRYVVKMEKEHEPTVIENVAYGAAYN